jgi:ATP-dependent Clp protease, protease subunit
MAKEKEENGLVIFRTRLVGEVNDSTTKELLKDIDEANSKEDVDLIKVTLTSGGGSLQCGFAIYDHIRFSEKPVDIWAAGYCMSAAVMILQAARERISYPHTVFMVHPSRYKIEETRAYEEVEEMVNQYKRNHQTFLDLSIQRSGMSRTRFHRLCKAFWYMTPEEAKKFGKRGLIDRITH